MATNEEYELQLKDENNSRLLKYMKRIYNRLIPQDELHRCLLIALWKTIQSYDSGRGRKFISYLYKRCQWECNKWIYNRNNEHKLTCMYDDTLFDNSVDYNIFYDYLSTIPKKFALVIEQRILHKMTYKEISIQNGYSLETARKRYKSGINMLKNINID